MLNFFLISNCFQANIYDLTYMIKTSDPEVKRTAIGFANKKNIDWSQPSPQLLDKCLIHIAPYGDEDLLNL